LPLSAFLLLHTSIQYITNLWAGSDLCLYTPTPTIERANASLLHNSCPIATKLNPTLSLAAQFAADTTRYSLLSSFCSIFLRFNSPRCYTETWVHRVPAAPPQSSSLLSRIPGFPPSNGVGAPCSRHAAFLCTYHAISCVPNSIVAYATWKARFWAFNSIAVEAVLHKTNHT
jgi:hypothetical protein